MLHTLRFTLSFGALTFFAACGPAKPSIPTAPGSGNGSGYRPSEEVYVNPECRNPFPVDAFAGLDDQRISIDEFIDGAGGTYDIWQLDFYVREDRANPVAMHVRSWLSDRAPEVRAQAAQEARCQKASWQLGEGGVTMPDRISRHDGSLMDLWPTGFRFVIPAAESPLTFQSAFTATTPDPSGLKEWLAANGREAMIFRRAKGQYELRLRVEQPPRETTISAIYVWHR